ncbi:MAG: [FeFe] hydrogenase, group A [Propionibacteriaceae bacterium]|jgi:formate dehydrogenase major subunit|nr:[FeFe] hydrogenase, group A [Propionibacteriaceae bacterium]
MPLSTAVLDEQASAQRVSVTVDGHRMEVIGGLTVLQSLLQQGVHVPSLCHDVRLRRSNGNCGLCMVEVGEDHRPVKACITPITEGMEILTRSASIDAFRAIRMEQLLADHNADCLPPCQETCPAHIDIQRYLALVADGNIGAALRVIKDRNPFPSACGRVCPHPCEAQCRRNLVDQPVAINQVKRFVADQDLFSDQPWIPDLAKPTGKRVAIIGAGPSGLSAAYFAAIKGHNVTVFDRRSKPGGMMRYGIPEYRLPKATLDAEIALIESLGVTLRCGISLGTHVSLEDVQRDFDAVYLAIGSWSATPLRIDGDSLPGVHLGINYLHAVTNHEDSPVGDRVLVVGGGNTAIDCARTAIRKGAKHVALVYRRTQTEMPAESYEVAEAVAEGVQLELLTAPESISQRDGHLVMKCLRMELGEPDRSGRRRPVAIPGSEFGLDADTIIGAIGQRTDTSFLYNDLPVRLNRYGDIDIDGATMQCSEPKIFAGGDCVTGPATVIQAVAAGRRAAEAMDEFVMKGYVRPSHEPYDCSRGSLEDLPRAEFETMPKLARHETGETPMNHRGGFEEVEIGLTGHDAQAEAKRCLKCGCKARFDCDLRWTATGQNVEYRQPLHIRPRLEIVQDHPFIVRDHNKCISCGRCVAACAEIEGPGVLAYQFHDGMLRVGTSDGRALIETDCVSCGQCVAACPCGALDYTRERAAVFQAINDPKKLVVGFIAPSPRSVLCAQYGVPFDQASGFIAGLMRSLGFDKVFDFSFAADLTIMEETTEFLGRVSSGGVMPQFTSCCPGWVNWVEKKYPALIPHLSTCKSPQAMMGATVKNHFAKKYGVSLDDLYVVSIVPCLAKKYEAARPELAPDGIRDVDAVVTTTEFIEMLDMVRIDPAKVAHSSFDEPYSRVTGAGVLFGASGGVAEAALRMAVEKLTGEPLVDHLDFEEVRGLQGFKHAAVTAGGKTIRVAVASGLGNAAPLIERVVAGEDVGYDLVEIMACPGGCIAGAGNPAPELINELRDRQEVLIDIDKTSTLRKSQDNPDILRLYDDFYGEPNSELAHELLHTSYSAFHGSGGGCGDCTCSSGGSARD